MVRVINKVYHPYGELRIEACCWETRVGKECVKCRAHFPENKRSVEKAFVLKEGKQFQVAPDSIDKVMSMLLRCEGWCDKCLGITEQDTPSWTIEELIDASPSRIRHLGQLRN